MVFTIPEEFRKVLGVDHSLYKGLIDAYSAQNSETLRLKLPRYAMSRILFFINIKKCSDAKSYLKIARVLNVIK
jgi:hypothetical protein